MNTYTSEKLEGTIYKDWTIQRHRQGEFEDTKGVTRIRKSKKNRQHNGQKKRKKTK
jgi:hypothetical protein